MSGVAVCYQQRRGCPLFLGERQADMTEAAKQLRHANKLLAIAGAYPGRGRAQPRGKVIET